MENNMKLARFLKKLTLDILFLKTGISQSKLSRIERNIFTPTDREKALISKALGKSVKEIFPESKKK